MTVSEATPTTTSSTATWQGLPHQIAFDEAGMLAALQHLDQPCYIVRVGGRVGVATSGTPATAGTPGTAELLATLPPVQPATLGDTAFRQAYGVRYTYMAGAMANGIASADLVIALGKAGMLGSFGAAGIMGTRLANAIQQVQQALPDAPYAFNLIHSPAEEAMERGAVELYLQHGVPTVEASAFLALTPHVVRYRIAGLERAPDGSITRRNRVIAKISRREVATQFMQPAPARLLADLVAQGWITPAQAELAQHVPVADDITVEADSGGHTDNRPLVALLPAIQALRDEVQAQYAYAEPIRVGAGGGIGTPQAALAAYMMGAAYVVTGSINQGCVEAGTSAHTRKLLAEAGIADVIMAPSADMFEMGVKVQLLKRGTLFPMRAQKLYEVYQSYESLDAIPADERAKLEKQIFRRSFDEVWADTVAFFQERDPEQIERANANPRRKMALVFRWYLGLSSRWSTRGEAGREMDYQVWCGPAMGAFNDWVRGTYLEAPDNRRVADVAHHMLTGTALLYRLQSARLQAVNFPAHFYRYTPHPR